MWCESGRPSRLRPADRDRPASSRAALLFSLSLAIAHRQAYVSQLSETLTTAKLDAAGLKVVIIGCGSSEPITAFKGTSSSLLLPLAPS